MSVSAPHHVGEDPKGGQAILVVAEEDSMREMLKDILESFGYRTLAIADLQDAARVASLELIDLIALELDRPGLRQVDGIEALRRSRSSLKILAILGDSSLASLESLADGTIWKPFSVDQMASMVSGFIGAPLHKL